MHSASLNLKKREVARTQQQDKKVVVANFYNLIAIALRVFKHLEFYCKIPSSKKSLVSHITENVHWAKMESFSLLKIEKVLSTNGGNCACRL